jgi:ribonucleoside-triphosphate reductase
MLRNRRIGCSVSGVAQFITQRGIDNLRQWLDAGYDHIQKYDKSYSEWHALPSTSVVVPHPFLCI